MCDPAAGWPECMCTSAGQCGACYEKGKECAVTSFEEFENDVRQQEGGYRKRGCGVGLLVRTLGARDGSQVAKALANPELTTAAIIRALKARHNPGDPWTVPSRASFDRHRSEICLCDREV